MAVFPLPRDVRSYTVRYDLTFFVHKTTWEIRKKKNHWIEKHPKPTPHRNTKVLRFFEKQHFFGNNTPLKMQFCRWPWPLDKVKEAVIFHICFFHQRNIPSQWILPWNYFEHGCEFVDICKFVGRGESTFFFKHGLRRPRIAFMFLNVWYKNKIDTMLQDWLIFFKINWNYDLFSNWIQVVWSYDGITSEC